MVKVQTKSAAIRILVQASSLHIGRYKGMDMSASVGILQKAANVATART